LARPSPLSRSEAEEFARRSLLAKAGDTGAIAATLGAASLRR